MRRLHPDDSTSTFLMVKRYEKRTLNIILFCKPQGEAMIGPKMHDDIDLKNIMFAFGFQTKERLKIFEKQVRKIVCIHATHTKKKPVQVSIDKSSRP